MAISEPQNRIRDPPRHTSPDTMQPVKIEHFPLVRIRHTERSILSCRCKSAPVPGRVIPFLVLSPACLLFTDQLIGAARGKFFPAYRAYPYLTRLFRLFSELAYTFGAFFFSLLLPHAVEQQICELFKGIKVFPHMGHGRGSRGGGQTCPSFSPVNHFPQSGHLRMTTASFLHAERLFPFPSGR